jgi:hypothetical protein
MVSSPKKVWSAVGEVMEKRVNPGFAVAGFAAAADAALPAEVMLFRELPLVTIFSAPGTG